MRVLKKQSRNLNDGFLSISIAVMRFITMVFLYEEHRVTLIVSDTSCINLEGDFYLHDECVENECK